MVFDSATNEKDLLEDKRENLNMNYFNSSFNSL